jgi:hypothetical protein
LFRSSRPILLLKAHSDPILWGDHSIAIPRSTCDAAQRDDRIRAVDTIYPPRYVAIVSVLLLVVIRKGRPDEKNIERGPFDCLIG